MKRIIKTAWFIIVMCAIFYFSNQSGDESVALSDSLANSLLNYIYDLASRHPNGITSHLLNINTFVVLLEWFSNNIRNIAHFSEYFILFISAYECFKEYPIKKIILVSIIFCIVFACLDEFHQLFITDRLGSFNDILIDTSGSLCACLFWHKLCKR